MPEDIRSFLKRFTPEELADRGVLSTDSRYGYLLRGKNLESLILLMVEQDVFQIEATERNWFLTTGHDFENSLSGEQTSGNTSGLSSLGSVFNLQNRHINPFFGSPATQDISDVEPNGVLGSSAESGEIKFGLERDLQRALRINIDHLEQGLRIIDDGSERSVDAGRIDITAEDADGQIVVIELKAGAAQPEAIAQLLAYMGTIENPESKPIRGILVASDFNQRVVYAAQAVPNLSLKSYSFQFSFHDR
jgi:hypothetical protein